MTRLPAAFGLAGRITRMRFWLSLVLEAIALLLLGAVLYFYALSAGNYENGGDTPFPTGPVGIPLAALWFIALAAMLYALLRTCVKRLHDRDRSGWWFVLFVLLPDALWNGARELATRRLIPDAIAMALLAISGALFLWGVAEMGILPGSTGDNRFGPPP